MSKQAHLTISGKVQGVFFRDFTQKTAQSLEVKGWVRNAADGTVEAVLQGDEDSVKDMISRLKKGPSSADVNDIQVNWESPDKDFEGFEVRF
jgi:acylphosphatase